MSWSDLLIDMDILFVLPALVTGAFLTWQAASAAARLCRSVDATARSGSAHVNFHRS